MRKEKQGGKFYQRRKSKLCNIFFSACRWLNSCFCLRKGKQAAKFYVSWSSSRECSTHLGVLQRHTQSDLEQLKRVFDTPRCRAPPPPPPPPPPIEIQRREATVLSLLLGVSQVGNQEKTACVACACTMARPVDLTRERPAYSALRTQARAKLHGQGRKYVHLSIRITVISKARYTKLLQVASAVPVCIIFIFFTLSCPFLSLSHNSHLHFLSPGDSL